MEPLEYLDMGKAYPSPPLPEGAIRLLQIKPGFQNSPISCQLLTTVHEAAPSYEALSYVWGTRVGKRSITLELLDSPMWSKNWNATIANRILQLDYSFRVKFSVTSNCYSALKQLRYHDRERTVWIDAICINQSDTQERGSQVKIMSAIYQKAAGVIIYLGEDSDDSSIAIDFVTRLPSATPSDLRTINVPTLALDRLLNRPWFHRIWVIQEALFARRATVHCGTQHFDWHLLRDFANWCEAVHWPRRLPYVVYSLSSDASKKRAGDPAEDIRAQLHEARHCHATDARDKIFALLPFLDLHESGIILEPNYQHPANNVFTQYAAAIITEVGLDLLQAVQSPPIFGHLPSWVPDWTVPPLRSILAPISVERSHVVFPKSFPHPSSGQNAEDLWPKVLDVVKRQGVLRAYGHYYGSIADLGRPFSAGQSPWPIENWRAVLGNRRTVVPSRRDRSRFRDPAENAIRWRHEAIQYWDPNFLAVISAGAGVSPAVIERFLQQEPNIETAEPPIGSWARVVLDALVPDHSDTGESVVSNARFRDVPFNAAGEGLVLHDTEKEQLSQALLHCHARRFFTTSTGYMGLGPEHMDYGDRVYACHSSPVPLLFRELQDIHQSTSHKHVTLVGECFVTRNPSVDFSHSQQSDFLNCLYVH